MPDFGVGDDWFCLFRGHTDVCRKYDGAHDDVIIFFSFPTMMGS